MTPHLLHVFPSFAKAGVPLRIVSVIDAIGPQYRHSILALNGDYAAAALANTPLTLLDPPPFLHLPARLRRIGAILREGGYGLLMTHNWGSIEWAFANALGPRLPHVHFESGFNDEEADARLRRRNWLRRLALARCDRVVVPSHTLERIAREEWGLAPPKLQRIPNGVDLAKYAFREQAAGASAAVVVGTVAPLRAVKNIGRLLVAFANLPASLGGRLVIAGDGEESGRLQAQAAALGLQDRAAFIGHTDRVADTLSAFDVFAMSSDSEQMPNSLLQAMAAGRPVVATDVGDVKAILAPENREFVVPKSEPQALTAALQRMIVDAELRHRIGAANLAHVRREYDLAAMIGRYRDLFALAAPR